MPDELLTKESRGLPSNSGSGRDPYLELFDADLPLPPVVNEPFGDIIKPEGEKPPDLARLFVSTIELAFETCLEIDGMSGEERREDLRLSLRFCSSCNCRIASSIEEVMLNRSAVFSRCSIFPVYAPCRTCRSGVGCLKARLRPLAVRTIGLLEADRADRGEVRIVVSSVVVVAWVLRCGRSGRGRGMFSGTNGSLGDDPLRCCSVDKTGDPPS